jgi:hypothetical protein
MLMLPDERIRRKTGDGPTGSPAAGRMAPERSVLGALMDVFTIVCGCGTACRYGGAHRLQCIRMRCNEV